MTQALTSTRRGRADLRVFASVGFLVPADRWTIWIEQDGRLVSSSNNPLGVGPWADSRRASCEMWSMDSPDRYRIGHTYGSEIMQLYTVHHQWRWYPSQAAEVYSLNMDYQPDSCASSDGYRDAEILLVSHSLWVGQEAGLFINLEPQE